MTMKENRQILVELNVAAGAILPVTSGKAGMQNEGDANLILIAEEAAMAEFKIMRAVADGVIAADALVPGKPISPVLRKKLETYESQFRRLNTGSNGPTPIFRKHLTEAGVRAIAPEGRLAYVQYRQTQTPDGTGLQKIRVRLDDCVTADGEVVTYVLSQDARSEFGRVLIQALAQASEATTLLGAKVRIAVQVKVRERDGRTFYDPHPVVRVWPAESPDEMRVFGHDPQYWAAITAEAESIISKLNVEDVAKAKREAVLNLMVTKLQRVSDALATA